MPLPRRPPTLGLLPWAGLKPKILVIGVPVLERGKMRDDLLARAERGIRESWLLRGQVRRDLVQARIATARIRATLGPARAQEECRKTRSGHAWEEPPQGPHSGGRNPFELIHFANRVSSSSSEKGS